MLPEDLHLAPHVLIQVWDNKVGQPNIDDRNKQFCKFPFFF